ncbi:flagellar motor protein MotB [Paenibacillus sp. WLX1005]|uniref:flagellar motor protein MotB n=1 Tax=unclassified Paenibacillus TaxID=185978 RepID=UPI00398407FC
MSKKGKRHEPHEEHADESWLLPYSDLMTLLLALFITLFSMSSLDAAKFQQMAKAMSAAFTGGSGVLDENAMAPTEGEVPSKNQQDNTAAAADNSEQKSSQQKLRAALQKQEQQDLENLKRKLDQYIKENGLSSQLTTKLNQSELKVTISDNTLFASGQATVKTDSRMLAKSLSSILQAIPDYDIIVSGHTDNVPISNSRYTSNWNLSSDRALNFMQILLLNQKLDPRKFSAIGYGQYHPIADNSTNVGRAKNRRVEVAIVRKYVDSDVNPTLQSIVGNGSDTSN